MRQTGSALPGGRKLAEHVGRDSRECGDAVAGNIINLARGCDGEGAGGVATDHVRELVTDRHELM